MKQILLSFLPLMPLQTIDCGLPRMMEGLERNVTSQDVIEQCPNFGPDQLTPTFDFSLPLTLVVYVKRIIDLDDSNEEMSFSGSLDIAWTHALCLNEDYFHIKDYTRQVKLYPNPSKFWKPRIEIPQSQELLVSSNRQESLSLLIHKTYLSNHTKFSWIWSVRGTFKFHCQLELYLFPNDLQNCRIQFQTQEFALIYNFTNCMIPTAEMFAIENAIWDFQSVKCSVGTGYAGTSVANLSFQLARNPRFYLLHLVVPCVLLLVLELCSFALPSKGAERTSFTMTIYLAFVFIESFLTATLPQSPGHILFAEFIMFQSIFSTVITVYTALLSRFSRRLSKSFVTIRHRKISWLSLIDLAGFSISLISYAIISGWIILQYQISQPSSSS